MKVIYVAGPFRGATTWEIEQNVRRAEELGLAVARLGAMPLIPHTNTRYFQGCCPDQFFLDGTLELLRRCDAIILTPDWARSTGARGERFEATARRMPVFQTVDELALWLKEWEA